jgi:S1-C subfamily serine protease
MKNIVGMMLIAVGFLFQGCTILRYELSAGGKADALYASAIDDEAMKEKLTTEAKKRLEAKTLTSGDTLRSQLKRRTTKVTFTQPKTRPMPVEDQYAYGRSSVVIMGSFYMCGKCNNPHMSTAAGFAVAEDGVFLTNYHVVASVTNSVGMAAITAEGQVGGVTEILACNPVEDWALIRIPELKLKPLPLKGNISVGTEIFLVSHPNEHFFSYGKGHVARYGKGKTVFAQDANKVKKVLGQTEWLEITAEFGKGASGGPVMDACGNVVGLISRVEVRKSAQNNPEQAVGSVVFKQCTPINLVIEGGSASP